MKSPQTNEFMQCSIMYELSPNNVIRNTVNLICLLNGIGGIAIVQCQKVGATE
jgi:hypothetical protein